MINTSNCFIKNISKCCSELCIFQQFELIHNSPLKALSKLQKYLEYFKIINFKCLQFQTEYYKHSKLIDIIL